MKNILMATLCWIVITVADWLLDMNEFPQG